MPPVGSQLPARDLDATRTSNAPSAPRMISWLVKPYRCSEFATRCPFWSYSVNVQNRAAGVTPLTTTSQRPSSGRLRSSVVAENATPSPVPIGRSPLRGVGAREYGATPAVPVLGRAVQAPIVSVPRSVPRVAVSHVAPRPTTVARINASKVMNISRTSVLAWRSRCRAVRRTRREAFRECDRIAGRQRLDGCHRVGRGGFPKRPAGIVEHFLHANQNIRTTFGQDRRRPRLGVRNLGRASRGASNSRRFLAGAYTGDLFDLDALMRHGHDVVPCLRRQRTAGHAVGRRIIVIAVPDRAGEVAGISDEPGVAIGAGGAGFAGGRDAVECGGARGAPAADVPHHPRHVGCDGRRNGLQRLLAVA